MTNDKAQSSNKCQMTNKRSLEKSLFAGQNLFSTILKLASTVNECIGTTACQNSPFGLKQLDTKWPARVASVPLR